MGVSRYISQIIDNNRRRLVNDLPIKQFLIDLRNENVLNDDDVDELEEITPANRQNDRFIRILVKRDDEAFHQFCNLLIRNQAKAIQNLGKDLLQQINKGKLFC